MRARCEKSGQEIREETIRAIVRAGEQTVRAAKTMPVTFWINSADLDEDEAGKFKAWLKKEKGDAADEQKSKADWKALHTEFGKAGEEEEEETEEARRRRAREALPGEDAAGQPVTHKGHTIAPYFNPVYADRGGWFADIDGENVSMPWQSSESDAVALAIQMIDTKLYAANWRSPQRRARVGRPVSRRR